LVSLEKRQKIYEENRDETSSCWILEIPGTRFLLKHAHTEQLLI
jgi:hypothetical protein